MKLNDIENLDDLYDTLCSLSDEEIEGVDGSDLPVFGYRPVENTREVWSWDDDRFLTSDANGEWVIEDRCPACGEAPFHCHHAK